ncbi:2864_t:CDS:2, partial [Ambispora leptoticha]
FILDIGQNYKVNLPLSPEIMTANLTEKPDLPENPEQITDYSILTPNISTKTLTEIKIQTITTEETNLTNISLTKPTIPNKLDEILNYLKNNNINTTQLTLPITDQKAVSETLKILHQHFTVKTIPNSVLVLPPLPEPIWGIFSQ